MIQEFSIKNFLSIRDRVTISFLPKKLYNDDSSSHLLIEVNSQTQLLKSAIMYGANASGKTNILEGLSYIQELLTDNNKNKEESMRFHPFYFDENTVNEPGYFELIFYIEGIKYWYEVQVDKRRILSEKLVYYPFRKPAKVYDRNVDEITFGDSLNLSKYDKEILKGNSLTNITVIAAIGKINLHNSVLDSIYSFFNKSFLDIITPKTDLQGWAMEQMETMSENEKFIMLTLLNQADLNIKNIEITSEELIVDEKMIDSLKKARAPQSIIDEFVTKGKIETKSLEFLHSFLGAEKALKDTFISNGTRRYFGLCTVLEKLLFESHFLAIDELETSLHPDLLLHFYLTFLVNSKTSQILFTTHNQTLLESDFIRKDMLYFCEKDRDYGFTFVNRGSDFGIHKNNSIANFYKIGKLGAVPELGSVQLFDLHGDCLNE